MVVLKLYNRYSSWSASSRSSKSTPTSFNAQTCTMQTRLPNLPFMNHGTAEFDPVGAHSASTPTPQRFPRTDLRTLRLWASFSTDIHEAITARPNLPSTPFYIGPWTSSIPVEEEEDVRFCAKFALHEPVRAVLRILGVNGQFSSGHGNVAVVGNPDLSWISTNNAQPRPKLVVRVPVTTFYLLLNPATRLNTKLGGWRIWRILRLLSTALMMMRIL